jgi:amidase
MAVQPITAHKVGQISSDLGLGIEDVDAYARLVNGWIPAYQAVDAMPDNLPAVKYPRADVHRPERAANPHNAWSYRLDLRGASEGKLKGKTVAIKDNVLLAGVPMSNGSATLDGYVPEFDATIVTRILDSGGTIIGKTHCEWFCFSGSSYTNHTGFIQNPHKPGYSAGGSSSGSGVVVATGEADMAIGCDQGGSIRIPCAYCGIYGLKPTHGLVPYTGILGIEPWADHVGPMTRSVDDNALLLEVIAGPDGVDARQRNIAPQTPYTDIMRQGAAGLRIAIIQEGFNQPNSEPDLNEKVRRAADVFKRMGAVVHELSIPLHAAGLAISAPVLVQGLGQTLRCDTIGINLGCVSRWPDGFPSRMDSPSPGDACDHQNGISPRTVYHGTVRLSLLR